MSTTTAPMSLRTARAVAAEMVEALRPYCHRVAVAGSIRRGRDWVNDIEIVAIPKSTVRQPDMDIFGEPLGKPKVVRDPGFVMVVDSIANPLVKGKPSDGRYLQFFTRDGVKVDLFMCVPDTWGYIYTIRTGSADFTRALAARWVQLGYKGVEGQLTRFGKPVPVPEEADLFALLGMSVPPPHARELTAKGLSEWI